MRRNSLCCGATTTQRPAAETRRLSTITTGPALQNADLSVSWSHPGPLESNDKPSDRRSCRRVSAGVHRYASPPSTAVFWLPGYVRRPSQPGFEIKLMGEGALLPTSSPYFCFSRPRDGCFHAIVTRPGFRVRLVLVQPIVKAFYHAAIGRCCL
jgi:hypothetical protein